MYLYIHVAIARLHVPYKSAYIYNRALCTLHCAPPCIKRGSLERERFPQETTLRAARRAHAFFATPIASCIIE